MNEIYLLSGLGADKRVFEFVDFSGFKVKHINWIEPLGNEAIEDYARRLLTQINDPCPVLIGVSFGGIIGIELGKLIDTEKIILISSAKTRLDIPFYFRWIGRLNINRLIPSVFLTKVNALAFWLFGVETRGEKELLRGIIIDTNIKFLRWAVDKIVNWQNETLVKGVYHIHGDRDRILPLKTADFTISGGGHLMIVSKGDQIGRIILKTLTSQQL
ncbi:alpha/beta hydrolase [uncultured Imperialibacter sp.]|uniref:alpha/beta hydrolase n=1 Tax=uncultured Imperialibacter sp. TaxID=1672639 RepID=UPI0030D8BEC7|tara:strand:+ start:1098 stop:1745 length:648 start_codon:yes stop_codon:yes gene_type:complete